MFECPQRFGRGQRNLSLVGSVAVHSLVLLALCLRPSPIFVKPLLIAHGDRGLTPLLYFAPQGLDQNLVAPAPKSATARIHLRVQERLEFNAKVTSQKDAKPENSESVSAVTAGSPHSSDLFGFTLGAGISPAIETTLLDPPVLRSEIPPGVEGDVIVEITIDEQGYVIGTRLLKGLGYGIDEKIIATVRNWHYRPATKDGVPIPSKYDAHWHFRG
jgi:TonB family protein